MVWFNSAVESDAGTFIFNSSLPPEHEKLDQLLYRLHTPSILRVKDQRGVRLFMICFNPGVHFHMLFAHPPAIRQESCAALDLHRHPALPAHSTST